MSDAGPTVDASSDSTPTGLFRGYLPPEKSYDEVFTADGEARASVRRVIQLLDQVTPAEFQRRDSLARETFLRHGVTFAVYSDKASGVERVFPFDLIPRTIPSDEWRSVERGLHQRIQALELFLDDVYGAQRSLNEGIVPRRLVEASSGLRPEMMGVRPRGGVRIHISGIDLIRDSDGRFLVLEDNIRTPSGVSYVLENRAVLKRVHPHIFRQTNVQPVDDYPQRLSDALASLAPVDASEPRIVILTPGAYNSAYFEHSFLARRMGCELVEGRDLFVSEDRVWVRTTYGPQPVDVIYRRIDDAFLDPEVFRKDSTLGVPGLVRAYAKGNVVLANGIGNGVADDKAIYPFVPDLVRFFLDEDPILGQVQTFVCEREKECAHVLANLESLVVKRVDSAGGYGMLIGPQASRKELREFRELIRADPRGYIAQPRIELSTCPTWTGRKVEPRRVDLRPYIVSGATRWVLPGGLTRVALRKGSYVVNSSQGGGSKDTWIVDSGGEWA